MNANNINSILFAACFMADTATATASVTVTKAKGKAIEPDTGTISSPIADIMAKAEYSLGFVPVDNTLILDETNTREAVNFANNVSARWENIKLKGYLPQYPIVVEAINGNNHVINGNSRAGACLQGKATEPEAFAKAVRNGLIPAIIFTGLTPADRARLAVDQGKDQDRMGLNEWEQYLALKKLAMAGVTETQAAIDLQILVKSGKDKGLPARSYVQVRYALAKLPAFVADDLHAHLTDTATGKTSWSDIMPLRTAYKADNKIGLPFPEGGPGFKAVWDAIQNPKAPTVTEAVNTITPSDLTTAKAVTVATMTGSRYNQAFILWLTGQTDRTDLSLEVFDGIMMKLEASNPEAFARILPPSDEAKAEAKAKAEAEAKALKASGKASGKAKGKAVTAKAKGKGKGK